MDLKQIYHQTLKMYPERIDLSGAKFFEESNGYLFPLLAKAYDVADENAAQLSEWHSLLVWVIYQALHDKAKMAFIEGNSLITTQGITDQVKLFLLYNLDQEGYEQMKQEFIVSDF